MGGAQFRSYWLARGLVQYTTNEISFLVYDYGQKNVEVIDGIRLVRMRSKRMPQYFGRWTKYLRKLQDHYEKRRAGLSSFTTYFNDYLPGKDFDAERYDVYLIFGLNSGSLEISERLAHSKAKVVFFLTHDEDVADFVVQNTERLTRHGQPVRDVWEIIHQNHVFVSQNQYQHDRITSHFGKRSLLIKNPINLQDARPSTGQFILWVGRDHEIKQPLLFLALAKLLPQRQFVMILNASPGGAYAQIERDKPANLRLIAYVPLDEIEQQFFAKASLFVSTAVSEGFHNTFLQAGKFSVPVVSMNVDPFDYIKNYRCGETGFASTEDMAARIEAILRDGPLYREMAGNSYRYFSENHDLRLISHELSQLLNSMD